MEKQSLEQQTKNIVFKKLIKLIEKYPDKDRDWDAISENLFEKDYEKELQKLKNFKNIEEELIQKTWHPSRFQIWGLDEDQKDNQEE